MRPPTWWGGWTWAAIAVGVWLGLTLDHVTVRLLGV